MRIFSRILLLCVFIGLMFSLPARAEDCRYCSIHIELPSLEPELDCVRISFKVEEVCQCVLQVNLYNDCSIALSISESNVSRCQDINKCQNLEPAGSISLNQNLLFFDEVEEIYVSEKIYIDHNGENYALTVSAKVNFWDNLAPGCNSAGSGNPLAGAFWMMAGIILMGRLRRRASKEFVDNYQSPEVL